VLSNCHIELFSLDNDYYQLRLFDSNYQLLDDYPLKKSELAGLIQTSQNRYQMEAADLPQQGQKLWQLINGPKKTLRELHKQGLSLQLSIKSAEELAGLPWEILHNGQEFLCLAKPGILVQRQIQERNNPYTPATRPLRVLFMACSPLNVEPVLNFEQEEARILEGTAKHPLFLHVEESGSLEGLQEQIEAYEEDFFDVIHLTGHATIAKNDKADDDKEQPVFIMEDIAGQMDRVSPERLAEVFDNCGRYPRVLFLSGCRTGESRENLRSFSEQLVRLGLPAVLGWALPVYDDCASEGACYFYEKLSTGLSIAQALIYARKQVYDYEFKQHKKPSQLYNWHLLRLYSDASCVFS